MSLKFNPVLINHSIDFLFFLLCWLWMVVFFCHWGRTFFMGEVGLVTWIVGLVGGDTVLVEVVVVLLLTDADGLVFSENQQTTDSWFQPLSISSLAVARTHTHTHTTCFSLRFGIFVVLLFAGAARFILFPLLFFIHLLWLQGLDAWGALLWLQQQRFFAETEISHLCNVRDSAWKRWNSVCAVGGGKFSM